MKILLVYDYKDYPDAACNLNASLKQGLLKDPRIAHSILTYKTLNHISKDTIAKSFTTLVKNNAVNDLLLLDDCSKRY